MGRRNAVDMQARIFEQTLKRAQEAAEAQTRLARETAEEEFKLAGRKADRMVRHHGFARHFLCDGTGMANGIYCYCLWQEQP